MGKKIIFYFLIIVVMCFGQESMVKSEVCVSLSVPGSIYTKPLLTQSNFAMHRLMYRTQNNADLSKYFYTNILKMQVEGESLKPRTSPRKTVASYGNEYVVSTISSALIYCVIYKEFYRAGVEYEPWQYPIRFSLWNMAGDMVISTSLIWGVGKLWGKEGSIIKTAIGIGTGSLIGSGVEYLWDKWGDGRMVPRFVIPFTSSLGGVIGFNLR